MGNGTTELVVEAAEWESAERQNETWDIGKPEIGTNNKDWLRFPKGERTTIAKGQIQNGEWKIEQSYGCLTKYQYPSYCVSLPQSVILSRRSCIMFVQSL